MPVAAGRWPGNGGRYNSAMSSSTIAWQASDGTRALADADAPLTEPDLAARFTGKGPWKKRLPQIIDTLEALGRVRRQGEAILAAS